MEYQKLINLLANTPNHPSKFRTKNWVEENDRSHGTYSTNSKIKFKTSMLRSSLCEYSDPCILVSGTITITGEAAYNLAKKKEKLTDERDKGAIFKNYAPFTKCVSETKNTQIVYAQ